MGEIYFRIEKINLDGFPASPEAKIGVSVSYGGKVYPQVELMKAKEIDTLNLNWSFDIHNDYDQKLTITIYKSRILKKSSVIGGLILDLSAFRPDMVYHRFYTLEPVDSTSAPQVTCTIHIDEQAAGRFNAMDEPNAVSQAMVDEELDRAEAELEKELRERREAGL